MRKKERDNASTDLGFCPYWGPGWGTYDFMGSHFTGD